MYHADFWKSNQPTESMPSCCIGLPPGRKSSGIWPVAVQCWPQGELCKISMWASGQASLWCFEKVWVYPALSFGVRMKFTIYILFFLESSTFLPYSTLVGVNWVNVFTVEIYDKLPISHNWQDFKLTNAFPCDDHWSLWTTQPRVKLIRADKIRPRQFPSTNNLRTVCASEV